MGAVNSTTSSSFEIPSKEDIICNINYFPNRDVKVAQLLSNPQFCEDLRKQISIIKTSKADAYVAIFPNSKDRLPAKVMNIIIALMLPELDLRFFYGSNMTTTFHKYKECDDCGGCNDTMKYRKKHGTLSIVYKDSFKYASYLTGRMNSGKKYLSDTMVHTRWCADGDNRPLANALTEPPFSIQLNGLEYVKGSDHSLTFDGVVVDL